MAKSHSIPDLEDYRRRIRAAGLRGTPARAQVLRCVEQAATPLTHGEVADVLAARGVDKATVYRNLTDLTEAGLLGRTELGDHVWRFEPRGAGRQHAADHPHFVCTDCGQVSCLGDVKVDVSPAPGSKKSIIGSLTEILFKGKCGRCV